MKTDFLIKTSNLQFKNLHKKNVEIFIKKFSKKKMLKSSLEKFSILHENLPLLKSSMQILTR